MDFHEEEDVTRVRQKRKLSTDDHDESGIQAKVARYDSGVKLSQTPTEDAVFNLSLLSRASSSGNCSGTDLTNRTMTKQSSNDMTPVKSTTLDTSLVSPADSAFGTSPGTGLICAPESVGYSSGIEADIHDLKSPSMLMPKVLFPNNKDRILGFFRRNFRILKDEVEAKDAANRLYQAGVILTNDLEKILEGRSRRDRCDSFIKAIVCSKKLGHPSAIAMITYAMKDYDYLVEGLKKEEQTQGKKPVGGGKKWKKIDIIGQLHACADKLVEDIDPKRFIDDLVVSGVLSFDDHTYLLEATHRADAVENLIKCVVRNAEESFMPFCRAIGETYPEHKALLLNPAARVGIQSEEYTLIARIRDIKCDFSFGRKDAHTQTSVKFSFKENVKEIERMIVDENIDNPSVELMEEAMEVAALGISGISFSSVRIDLSSLSSRSQLRFLQRVKEDPSYLENWLKCSISDKMMAKLAAAGAKSVTVDVIAKWPDPSEMSCRCHLKKEAIVKHFTYMTDRLKDVEKIVQAFVEFPSFDDGTKKYFAEILKLDETVATKTEMFLRKVLDCKLKNNETLEGSNIYLCLLEKLLRETGQRHILEKLLASEQANSTARKSIKPRHIRLNMNYLLDEIEPKMFASELHELPRTDTIVEEVVSKESRLQRCKKFLQFIVKEGQVATDWFVGVLRRKNLTDVVNLIQSSVPEDEKDNCTDLKEGIIENYKSIVEEVDGKMLGQTFLDRKQMRAKQFDLIMKKPTRRGRLVWLLKHILNGGRSVQMCFVDSLQINGYGKLAEAIRQEKDKYRECPRLSALLGQGNRVTIRAELDITIEKAENQDSSLQISLLKMLYAPNDVAQTFDKSEQTRHWVEIHAGLDVPMERKRKYNEDSEEVPAVKRKCDDSTYESSASAKTACCPDQEPEIQRSSTKNHSPPPDSDNVDDSYLGTELSTICNFEIRAPTLFDALSDSIYDDINIQSSPDYYEQKDSPTQHKGVIQRRCSFSGTDNAIAYEQLPPSFSFSPKSHAQIFKNTSTKTSERSNLSLSNFFNLSFTQ